MSKYLILSIVTIIGSVTIAKESVTMWNDTRPQCDVATLARELSPNGSWTAVLHEATCDLGLPAITDITTYVTLFSIASPAEEVHLLGIDTSGDPDLRPRMVWSSSDILQITVPNISILKVLTRHVDNITVDLRFDPDDPTARAAWLKKEGWTPDPLEGTRNPRTQIR